MLIKLFEACGAIYKSATRPALNSLHRPYRFLWTAFFFTPGLLALCVTKRIREKLWKRIVQGTFLPTFSLPGMDGWVSLFDIALLQTNPVLVQFHAFITTLRLGFAMSSSSFSEESVKIIHLTYAKVGVGGSKNSPWKEQIIIALQESCDPVVMVRETHILKLAIWPVLLDVDFTGTKELLYLFLNLRN